MRAGPGGLKDCPRCGRALDAGDFYRNRSRPDGRADECRGCARDRKNAWAAVNREHILDYMARYNQRKREERG